MDLLSDILSRIQLSGTLYFRTSFTAPWGVKVPSYKNVARFHFAHKGRCFVKIDNVQSPSLLEQGDLIIIPKGASHKLYSDPSTENQAAELEDVLEQSGFNGTGTLVYGEPGTDHETQLVCGHFAFSDDAQNIVMDALPSHIHIKNYGEDAGIWMENTLKVIGNEAGKQQLGGDMIAMKMSEIIFAQALRAYLESEGSSMPVLAGFADKNISKALTAIHKQPGFAWTLEGLAEIAVMSRTAFASRFSQCMTTTPLSYITYWRMQIARDLLANTNEPIINIAEKAGYQSEAAFGRVFKKHISKAPAIYRREVRSQN